MNRALKFYFFIAILTIHYADCFPGREDGDNHSNDHNGNSNYGQASRQNSRQHSDSRGNDHHDSWDNDQDHRDRSRDSHQGDHSSDRSDDRNHYPGGPGSGGSSQPDPDCKNTTFDICLLADESGSVDSRNYEKEKQFFATLVSRFDVGQGAMQTRFAFFEFSTRTYRRFSLKDLNSPQAVINAIQRQTYQGTKTDIVQALDKANTELQTNGRSDAVKLVIIMTDGRHTADGDPIASANAIRAHGGSVFVIGITDKIDYANLAGIAGSLNHLFRVEDFDTVVNKVQDITKAICQRSRTSTTRATTTTSKKQPTTTSTTTKLTTTRPTTTTKPYTKSPLPTFKDPTSTTSKSSTTTITSTTTKPATTTTTTTTTPTTTTATTTPTTTTTTTPTTTTTTTPTTTGQKSCRLIDVSGKIDAIDVYSDDKMAIDCTAFCLADPNCAQLIAECDQAYPDYGYDYGGGGCLQYRCYLSCNQNEATGSGITYTGQLYYCDSGTMPITTTGPSGPVQGCTLTTAEPATTIGSLALAASTTTLPTCTGMNTDFCVLIDESAYVGAGNFAYEIAFVQKLVQVFTHIGQSATRFSVFGYAGSPVMHIGLSDPYTNAAEIANALSRLTYNAAASAGSTDFVLALNACDEHLRTKQRSTGDVKGIIFVTGGKHGLSSDPVPTARSIVGTYTEIFTIGVGDQVDQDQLDRMGSYPVFSTYHVSDYSLLADSLSKINVMMCVLE